jgi:hypothetical protein
MSLGLSVAFLHPHPCGCGVWRCAVRTQSSWKHHLAVVADPSTVCGRHGASAQSTSQISRRERSKRGQRSLHLSKDPCGSCGKSDTPPTTHTFANSQCRSGGGKGRWQQSESKCRHRRQRFVGATTRGSRLRACNACWDCVRGALGLAIGAALYHSTNCWGARELRMEQQRDKSELGVPPVALRPSHQLGAKQPARATWDPVDGPTEEAAGSRLPTRARLLSGQWLGI